MSETNEIKAAAATLGRLGGSKKTKKKARAARENGRRGGRPRRDSQIEQAAREVVETWNEPVSFAVDEISNHASKLKRAMAKLSEVLKSAR